MKYEYDIILQYYGSLLYVPRPRWYCLNLPVNLCNTLCTREEGHFVTVDFTSLYPLAGGFLASKSSILSRAAPESAGQKIPKSWENWWTKCHKHPESVPPLLGYNDLLIEVAKM